MEDDRTGRWHGLVYMEVGRSRDLVALAEQKVGNVGQKLVRKPHVSVSRPFWLWAHEIDRFVETLRDALKVTHAFDLAILDDLLRLDSGDGRTFLALRVDSPALKHIVSAVDTALVAFGREPYFDDPIFHLSVAVLPPPPDDDLSDDSDSDSDDLYGSIGCRISHLVCKCGHRSFKIPLPD